MIEISTDKFIENLKALSVHLGCRFYGTEVHKLTTVTIVEKCKNLTSHLENVEVSIQKGEMTVENQKVIAHYHLANPKVNLSNIVVKISPKNFTETVVFGAHYDTVPLSKGAMDNGSGVALVLCLLENLAKITCDKQLIFVFFDCEELGTLGSTFFVNMLSNEEIKKVKAALIFDMFLSRREDVGLSLVVNLLGGRENGEFKMGCEEFPIGNTISKAIEKSNEELNLLSDKTLWSPRHYGHSDHQPFAEKGMDSANVTIRGGKEIAGKLPSVYHTKDDIFQEFDLDLFDKCKKVLSRSVELILEI